MELEEAIEGLNSLKIIFEIDNGANFEATPVTQKEIANEIKVVINHLTKQEKMIHEAYAKANNYLYFNDSSDYEAGLWEVIRSLRPDLAEKWDNGDCEPLKYIEEESE